VGAKVLKNDRISLLEPSGVALVLRGADHPTANRTPPPGHYSRKLDGPRSAGAHARRLYACDVRRACSAG